MVFALTVMGCAQGPRDQGYARAILDRPLPPDKGSAVRECDFLDSEIIRQQNMAQALPQRDLLPETALAIQKATQTNITALKLRTAQLACPSQGPTVPTQSGDSTSNR